MHGENEQVTKLLYTFFKKLTICKERSISPKVISTYGVVLLASGDRVI